MIKRLKIMAERDDDWYSMDASDERNRLIEEYLKNNGWKEKYVALWQNPEYPRVECVDTNSGSVMVITKGLTREYAKDAAYTIGEGIRINTDEMSPDVMVYDSNEFIVSDVNALKNFLGKIK
jgi:hypothetical protein